MVVNKIILGLTVLLLTLGVKGQPFFNVVKDSSSGGFDLIKMDDYYLRASSKYNYAQGFFYATIEKLDLNGIEVDSWPAFEDTNVFHGFYFNTGLTKLPDGGYFISAVHDSTFPIIDGDMLLRIRRMNKNHELIWEKDFLSDIYTFELKKTFLSSENNLVLGGGQRESEFSDLNNFYLIIDLQGKIKEYQKFGLENITEFPSELLELPDGNLLFGGTRFVQGYETYLIKLSKQGDTLWTKTFSGQNNSIGNHNFLGTVAEDKSIVLIQAKNTFSISDAKPYFYKLDLNGNILIEKALDYDSVNFSYAGTPHENKDGSFTILAGGENFNNKETVTCMKLDPLGNKMWEKRYEMDPFSINVLWCDYQSKEDNLIFSGFYYDYSTGINVQDSWIVSINCNGEEGLLYPISDTCLRYDCTPFPMNSDFNLSQELVDLSNPTPVICTNLSANTLSKNWYVNGKVFYNLDTLNYSFSTPGFYDITLVSHHGACRDTVKHQVEVVDSIVSPGLIHIYPNPNSGQFTIKSHDEIASVFLYNNLGQTILNQEINYTEATIEISNASYGLYFLQIKLTNGKIRTEKILIGK